MTEDTAVADPPAPRPPASGADPVRFVLRGIGQTLITAGAVVLLFVVYEVWITNIFSDRANHRVGTALEKVWANGGDPLLPLPGGADPTIKLGTGIANVYMPRLGIDYHWTIVEGVNQDDLAKGPGHYPGTQLPGETGNFAVAGHRVGKGEPFLNLDKLRAGDAVVVETKTSWYVYRVKGREHGLGIADADGIPGREIVDPSAGRVLLPVPDHENENLADATERLMTMTTCHPKFTASQRMIVYASLGSTLARTGDAMPPAIKALYAKVKL